MKLDLPLDARSIVRLLLGFAALVGVLALVGMTLRAPLTAAGAWVVARLGLSGLFLAVVVLDPIPAFGFQPALFFGFTGGLPLVPLVLVAWIGAMVGASGAWALGRLLSRWQWLVALLDRWKVGGLLRAYGPRAIAVAAVGPFPFGAATLCAGVMRVPYRALIFGAAFRGVKITITALAFWLGWGAGA